jgi:chitodextrinase
MYKWNARLAKLLVLTMVASLFWMPGMVAQAAPHSHTIVLDGTNDFYDSSNPDKNKNETFATSSGDAFFYLTWDATNIYFAYNSNDITGTVANAPSKWVWAYFGGAGGTKSGVDYSGQKPNLPFEAKYHFRFKVDGSYSNLQSWNGTSWNSVKTLAWGADQARNDGNKLVEFKIPRSELGLTSANSLQFVANLAYEDAGTGDAMWAAVPSNSFGADGNGNNRSFSTFYDLDLNSENTAAAAQVYNYKLTNTAVTSSTATFSFDTMTGATAVVVQQSANGGTTWNNSTTSAGLSATSTSATVTGLMANTDYKFRLVVTGGTFPGSSAIVNAKTSVSTGDTTPPAAPTNVLASGTTSSSVTLNWAAATDNVGVTGYEIYRNGTKIGDSPNTTFTATGLSANTTYSFTVIAADAGANKSTPSTAISVTTLDTNKATIYYKKGFANPYIHYSIAGSSAWTVAPGTAIPTSEISGYNKIVIDLGTATSLVAAFNDGASNWDSNGTTNYTFNTGTSTYTPSTTPGSAGTVTAGPPVTDTTAPTVPSSLTSSAITAESVNLTWNASTDSVGVSGYEVYANGTKIANTLTNSYAATGLSPSTVYSFTVLAFDGAGNKSAQSSAVSVTTSAAVPVAYAHTIVLDGINDFYTNANPDKKKNELFGTSTVDNTFAFTWDATNVYFGYNSGDIRGEMNSASPNFNVNADKKWIIVYVGGTGGTKTGVEYSGQQPTLSFDAKYHIRFKVDGTFTNRMVWNGTEWANGSNYAWTTNVARNDANKFVEFKIPRADLGLDGANTVQVVAAIIYEDAVGASDAMWAAAPADSFGASGDGNDRNFSTFYEFDFNSYSNGPAAQLYNYNFKNTSVTVGSVSFSFSAQTGATALQIQQSTNGGASWSNTTVAESLNATSTTATATGLTANTDYKFRFVVTGGPNAGTSAIANAKTSTGVVDTQAPTAPTNVTSASVSQTTLTLNWTAATDNVGVTNYEIYRGTTKVGDSGTATTFNVTGLTAGTAYTFTVVAADAAGNKSSASAGHDVTTLETNKAIIYYKKGFTTPFAHYQPEGGTWTTSPGTAIPASEVTGYNKITIDLGTATKVTVAFNDGGATWDNNGGLNYTFNTGTSTYVPGAGTAPGTITVGAPVVDTENPTAPTNVTSASVTQTTLTLNWTAATDNVGVTNYEVYRGATKLGDSGTATTFNVTGLTAGTAYTFTVVAADAAGNKSSASAGHNVTTLETNKAIIYYKKGFATPFAHYQPEGGTWTSAPGTAIPASEVTGYNKITIDLGTATKVTVAFNDGGATWDNNGGLNYTFNTGTSTYVPGAGTAPGTITVGAPVPDTQPPTVPAGFVVENITKNSFNLTWSAATDNDKVSSYEVFRNATKIDTVSVTSYSFTGLTEYTEYQIYVIAVDASNNKSLASITQYVRTSDATAPSTPSGLTKSAVTASGFTVSWSASTDNSGTVTEYQVLRNGTLATTVSTTTHTFASLTEVTAYDITVIAKDAAGNVSAPSSVLTVTTIDVTAPTVPNGLTSTAITATGFTVSWNAATDNSGTVAGYDVLLNNASVGTVLTNSYSFTGLNQNTTYNVKVIAIDAASNKSAASSDLAVTTLDATAPSIPAGLVSAAINTTGFTVNWTASTDNSGVVAGYEVYLSSSLHTTVTTNSYTFTGLSGNTNYEVTIKSYDASGNKSAFSSALNVKTADGSKPTVPSNVTSSAVSASGFTVTWTPSSDDVGVSGYEIYKDNVKVTTTASTSYVFSGLDNYQDYSITIKAFDGSGNVSDSSTPLVIKTLDNEDPSIPSGFLSSNVTKNSFTVSWSPSSDNAGVTGYEVYRDDVLLSTVVTATYTFTGLTDNTTYNVNVSAKDAAGNKSSVSATFSVKTTDGTAPTVPSNFVSSGVTKSGFQVDWSDSTDAVGVKGYEVYLDGAKYPDSISSNYSFTGLAEFTSYAVSVVAYDDAGNKSTASTTLNVKTLDATAPTTPTGLQVTNVSYTSLTLNWSASTDIAGVTGYQVFVDGLPVAGETTPLTSYNVVSLTQGATYQLTVKAVDAAGNVSAASSGVSATTLVATDTEAPSAPSNLVSNELTGTSVKLSWTASTDNVAVTGYEIYDGTVLITTVASNQHTLTGLSDGKSYAFSVRAVDAVGNKSSASNAVAVNTPDVTPPTTPDNLTAINVTKDSITLSWTLSTDNVAVTAYEIYQDEVFVKSVNTATATISDLSEAISYVFAVKAVDAAANKSGFSSSITVTTADATPPNVPLNLKSEAITISGFKVSWDAVTDNTGVTGYEVYLNGALFSTVNVTSESFNGLDDFTQYAVTVLAVDGAGNKSAQSSALNVKTVDGTNPTTPTGLTSSAITATSFTVSWTASTDNDVVSEYEIYLNATLLTKTTGTSYNVTGLADLTTYSVAIKAVDAAGNKSTTSSAINAKTLDGTPPSVPSLLNSSAITSNSFTVSWNASSDVSGIKEYEVYRDGTLIAKVETNSYGFTGLSDITSYAITVKATDNAGNTSVLSTPLSVKTLDGTSPTAPTGLVASAVTSSEFTLNWTVSSDNVAVTGYEVYRDNVLVNTVTSGNSFVMTGLSSFTTYIVTLKALDAAGNKSTFSAPLNVKTLDATLPSTPTNVNVNPSTITATGFTVTWTASTDNDQVTAYEVLNGGTLVNTINGTSYTFVGQPDNTNFAITIRAVDASGNKSLLSDLLTVKTLDGTAPTVPTNLSATAGTLTASGVTVTWTASTDAVGVTSYEVNLNGTVVTNVGSTTYTFTGLQQLTAYNITVKAVDAAGNKSVNSSPLSVNTPDGTPPSKPAGVTFANLTTTGFVLTWSASTDNVAVTGYEVYRGTNKLATVNNTTYTVSGLAPGTVSAITVVAIDAANNKSTASDVLSVTTLGTPDAEAPSVPQSLSSSNTTQTGFTLSWIASSDNVAVTSYEILRDGTLVGTSVTNQLVVTGMNPGTANKMTVVAVDGSGNKSNASQMLVVFTLGGSGTADTQAPTVPTSVTSSSLTSSSLTLTWIAATDNTAVTSYEVFRNGVSIGTVTATTLNVTSLAPLTSYSFTVVAADAAGNKSNPSAPLAVTTTGSGTVTDTVAPGAPTGLQVSNLSAIGAKVTWIAATDNVGVVKYEVYRDGTQIAEVTVTEVNLNGFLSPGTTYAITIRAVDAAGNKSNPSSALSLTTPTITPVGDTFAPSVPAGLSVANVTANSFTISWLPSSDNVGVVAYEVQRNGVSLGLSVANSLNIAQLQAGTTYSMTVKAMDAAGNSSAFSTPFPVTTLGFADAVAPTAPTSLLVISKTATSAAITWIASTDNVGVTEYEVYRNNFKISSVLTNSFNDNTLQPNNIYTYFVRAKDAAGNVSASSQSLQVNTGTDITIPSSNPIIIKIEKQAGGLNGSLTRAYLDGTKLQEAVRSNSQVLLEVSGDHPQVRFEIDANSMKQAANLNPKAIISFRTDVGALELPLNALKIDALAMKLNTTAANMKLNIMVQRADQTALNAISDKISEQDAFLNSELVEFRINGETTDGRSKDIEDFANQYVVRVIKLAQPVDLLKSTVVSFDSATQRVQYVPAIFVIRNGQQQVLIKSLQNKMVAVISSDKSFGDVNGHWAQKEIDLLATKWVVKGANSIEFKPNASVTRAEFAAMLVRALGIEEDASAAVFKDVRGTEWFAGAVGAAVKAGLVAGFSDGRYKPNAQITRAEMAVMIQRASEFGGKVLSSEQDRRTELLAKFTDRKKIGTWATAAIAATMDAGLLKGKSATTFAPAAKATRAEATVILKRLLELVEFMN